MDTLDEYATRRGLPTRSEKQRDNIVYRLLNVRNDYEVVESISQYANYLNTYC